MTSQSFRTVSSWHAILDKQHRARQLRGHSAAEHSQSPQLRFCRRAEEMMGALVEMEARYAPNSPYPPDHYHPAQDEYFVIQQGEVTVRRHKRETIYRAGESFYIRRGEVHTMRNHGTTEAVVNWRVVPALKTQQFHESLQAVAVAGKPNLLQLAVLLHAFRAEFVLARPPQPIQHLFFGVLAFIGRCVGYRVPVAHEG